MSDFDTKNRARRFFLQPWAIIRPILRIPVANILTDKQYAKALYFSNFGKKLNLNNPVTYNQKLMWRKLYDHNPIYSIMVDKYAVRKYVSNTIGNQYLIPLIGVWDSFDEIDFEKLPDQFVLKCNHDSGGVYICKDKTEINKHKSIELKKFFEAHMKTDYYKNSREWAYKSIKRKIIAEKYMVDESGVKLKDYKIFAFDGEPFIIQVDYDRFVEHKRNLYNTNWEYINATIKYPTDPYYIIPQPENLDEMLELSAKLSKGFMHIRTDFYNINGKIYFGELTLYHGGGTEKFSSNELAVEMGNKMNLALAYKEN
jgi:hypothetical protein